MGLDGKKMMDRLTHLSETKMMKEVKPLSYALFPGYHCPLMGAMLTIKEIDGSILMVLGTDECSYYTKMATSGSVMATDGCEVVSCSVNQHDVTFGCQPKLEQAFKELHEEYHPKAVYIVTTCVLEITGDDVDAIADSLREEYDFPIMVVHAENFKTDDHLPGIESTMSASIALMKECAKTNSVNVLGLRLGDFRKSECARILKEANVDIGMMLPGKTSVDCISKAAGARCNIVVHPVGLPLAKEMEKQFGIPYVIFERYASPKNILDSYTALFKTLGLEMPAVIDELYAKSVKRTQEAKGILSGKTYISGNTALCNYEMHAFLTNELGLKPELLQISELDEVSAKWREEILKKEDPLVTRAANIEALKYVYPIIKANFNIGAGNTMEMMKYGTRMIRMMNAYNTLGFEVNEMLVGAFLSANEPPKMPGMAMMGR